HTRPQHLAVGFVVQRHRPRLAGDQQLHPTDAALDGVDPCDDPQSVETVFADVIFVLPLSYDEDPAVPAQGFIDGTGSTGTAHRDGDSGTGVHHGTAHR